jgi:hypothetical protein
MPDTASLLCPKNFEAASSFRRNNQRKAVGNCASFANLFKEASDDVGRDNRLIFMAVRKTTLSAISIDCAITSLLPDWLAEACEKLTD